MTLIFMILTIIGFCIALYAYITDKKIKQEPDYKPVCDISERISCTKPMKSKYSTMFFISNSFAGMLFYASIAILAIFNNIKLIFIISSLGAIATCFFAYLLFFKIRSLCIICISLYIINIAIFILAAKNLFF